jgi:hypothetical protein
VRAKLQCAIGENFNLHHRYLTAPVVCNRLSKAVGGGDNATIEMESMGGTPANSQGIRHARQVCDFPFGQPDENHGERRR